MAGDEPVFVIEQERGPYGPVYVRSSGRIRVFERKKDAIRAKLQELKLPDHCRVLQEDRSGFPDSEIE